MKGRKGGKQKGEDRVQKRFCGKVVEGVGGGRCKRKAHLWVSLSLKVG